MSGRTFFTIQSQHKISSSITMIYPVLLLLVVLAVIHSAEVAGGLRVTTAATASEQATNTAAVAEGPLPTQVPRLPAAICELTLP